jgi:hypothetical protein
MGLFPLLLDTSTSDASPASAEARAAFDRLASAKFRDHVCEPWQSKRAQQEKREIDIDGRVLVLIMRGYKPKDAVELALKDIALEFGNDPHAMAEAQAAADLFLRRLREGLM